MPEQESSLSQQEREAKVYALTLELAETKAQKKAAVGGFNDELKRLAAEIKELIVDSLQTS